MGSMETDSTQQQDATPEQIRFERIPVKKGVSEFGFTEVSLLMDVGAEAQFVTRGAFFLMAKMMNRGEAHEH